MICAFRTNYIALVAAFIIGVGNVYGDQLPTGSQFDTNCCDFDPCCNQSSCGCFWVRGDLLYLQACESGFGCDFGTTSITTSVSDGKIVTDIFETNDDIDFGWNLGFRVGVGYSLDSSWDVALYWTHFNENGKGHNGTNYAKLKLRFDEVDAAVGYNISYGGCFGFKPFFGVRYAKINQSLYTHLESTIEITATSATSVVISTKDDSEHFWGAGPLLGFEANFFLGCGFSVYGCVAGTLLYGEFKNRYDDSDVFAAAISNCYSSSSNCAVLSGLDAGIGIRYEICNVTLQLGLEEHKYFDYNQIGCEGDLNLYGLNASVGFCF